MGSGQVKRGDADHRLLRLTGRLHERPCGAAATGDGAQGSGIEWRLRRLDIAVPGGQGDSAGRDARVLVPNKLCGWETYAAGPIREPLHGEYYVERTPIPPFPIRLGNG